MNTTMPSGASGMGASAHGSSHGSSTTVTMRRFVREVGGAGGASPFVWRGLLPTLGLLGTLWFALGPFARGDIEATVASEVRSRLQAQGHGWTNVAVSGQQVLLSGSPPRAGAGDEALALARAATCPTWSGPRTCAVAVLGAFGALAAPAAPAAPQSPAAPSTPAVPPAPSAAAVACEAAFAKLLSTSRIEFASGGAAIGARSAPLLDKLAETARGCPGRFLVEGHTDNVGDADANQRLSEARAAAVRDALLVRGVPAVQLEVLGYGANRPLADNATEAGRAANRRIEFKALP
jgi:outer membrane protein OmpA-like peptidoglycan-associated protein